MSHLTTKSLSNWKISYNPYSDLFQIFNDTIFKTPDKDLKTEKRGFAVLFYTKDSNKPLMVEFTHAYKYLGDIDNMDKKHIIQSVIGYIDNHGRTT